MTNDVMTIDQLAAYLHLGKRTIYRMVKAKQLPATKIGGKWLFQRSHIDSWFHDRVKLDFLL